MKRIRLEFEVEVEKLGCLFCRCTFTQTAHYCTDFITTDKDKLSIVTDIAKLKGYRPTMATISVFLSNGDNDYPGKMVESWRYVDRHYDGEGMAVKFDDINQLYPFGREYEKEYSTTFKDFCKKWDYLNDLAFRLYIEHRNS